MASSMTALLFGLSVASAIAVGPQSPGTQKLCSGLPAQLAYPVANNSLILSYCSSNYPLGPVTTTYTAPTSTVLTTVATESPITTVTTDTLTATADATTELTTDVTTTTSVVSSTITENEIATSTVFTTTTTTTTTTINQFGKRDGLRQKRTTGVAPSVTPSKKKCSSVYPSSSASSSSSVYPSSSEFSTTSESSTASGSSTTVASSSATYSHIPPKPEESQLSSLLSYASSIIGEVCTCIETPQTSTISSTPLATSTVTATSTSSATASETVTTTPVVTSVIQSTDVIITTDVALTTSTSTTTTTVTRTSTATVTTFYSYPTCQPGSDFTNPGAGGCSANCYCDSSVSGNSVCDDALACGQTCDRDSDCPGGQFCLTGGYFATCPNGRTCASSASCTSTYSPAKLMFARAMGMPEVGAESMEKRESKVELVAPVRVGLVAKFP
ncbi:hypothetical protein JX265_003610 [Neoarthrinium moseri]|uniref:Antifreeze glycoprotein n=1 Tax=Neoarthrinium moseri TaxID=1658444 RepID=A0A9P9WS56_9PEZI|nr:hypothetical protein JX265_003610 [Neoarthrinium moseri]